MIAENSVLWNILVNCAFWIVVCLVHELGHAFTGDILLKKKGHLKVHWWGITYNSSEKITLEESGWIRYFGIMAGIVSISFLYQLMSYAWLAKFGLNFIWLYLFACFFDIMGIYQILTHRKHSWRFVEDIKLYDIRTKEVLE